MKKFLIFSGCIAYGALLFLGCQKPKKYKEIRTEINFSPLKKVAEDTKTNGIYRYEDKEFVCMVYSFHGAAIWCIPKGQLPQDATMY
jgi:hypothetical protein